MAPVDVRWTAGGQYYARMPPDLRYLPSCLRLLLNLQDAYPRFTPWDWFETDVLATTRAGLWIEIESKVSRADFRADRDKTSIPHGLKNQLGSDLFADGTAAPTTKWEILERCPLIGPAYFWFVTPMGILTADDIPDWAGWISYEVSSSGRPFNAEILRPAPRRNMNHLGEKEELRARRNIAMRYAFGSDVDAAADALSDLSELSPVLVRQQGQTLVPVAPMTAGPAESPPEPCSSPEPASEVAPEEPQVDLEPPPLEPLPLQVRLRGAPQAVPTLTQG